MFEWLFWAFITIAPFTLVSMMVVAVVTIIAPKFAARTPLRSVWVRRVIYGAGGASLACIGLLSLAALGMTPQYSEAECRGRDWVYVEGGKFRGHCFESMEALEEAYDNS